MKFDEAQRWLDQADPQITRDPSITKQIDQLKARAKEGTLTRNGAAAWYAMVQELRRLADYYERDLIRQLRSDGMTWAQVADAVQAQLNSRQAAQAKWKRLIDPTRRTTNGEHAAWRAEEGHAGSSRPPGTLSDPAVRVTSLYCPFHDATCTAIGRRGRERRAHDVDDRSWAPTEVDITRPSVARVYDFYLGGSHNFESDRTFGQPVVDTYPALPTVLRREPRVPATGVRHLVRGGVDQFLDLGSGIPTVGNVHEVAQAGQPGRAVVYVDHDPVAVTHSRELRRRPAADPCAGRRLPRRRAGPRPGRAGRRPRPATGRSPCSPSRCCTSSRTTAEPTETMARYLSDARARQPPGDQPHPLGRRARGRGRASSSTGRSGPWPSMHPRTTAEIAGAVRRPHPVPARCRPGSLLAPGLVEIIDADEAADDHPMLAGLGRRD